MKKYSRQQFSTLLLALAAGFVIVSCADEDIAKAEDNQVKDGVSFSVTDVQDALDDEMPTRATSTATYLTHSIDFNETGTSDMCLEETTVPGVNPTKPTPQTRALLKSTIDANFGAMACKNGSATPDFFYNKEVNKHGQMLQPEVWTSAASTLKFYAIYPYLDGTNNKQKLVQATAGSLPYIAFEASTDIANQTDLMTAETAPISYTPTGGTPHVVPLKFYHALTAIRFGIGQNLSLGKTIKSIEFQGVYKDGHFDLAGKTWSDHGSTENFKLDNVNVSTTGTQNTVIVKDGNTFLMVPQTVPAGAKIVVSFTDGTHITANIGGKTWAPGTTKTYMMTEKNSTWDYQLQTSDPATIAYNQTTSTDNYTIQSYRKDPTTNTFQKVKWKVVSYQESADGGLTWSAESPNKPNWLTNLSLTEGEGGTAAENGTPTVTTSYTDYLAPYNKVLQEATEKGSAGNYYDLSTHDFKGNATSRNTANSYLISSPGYYKIPLVYGNAIKNGATNESAYKTTNSGPNILSNFKDHNNQNITNPWITLTNGGVNVPDGVKIVWTDQSGIVEQNSLGLEGTGNNAFVHFRVPQDKIKNGNAVIAVTRGGVVVWSWHLWFDHKEVLETIKCTNYQGFDYNFTKQTLGFAYREWASTAYSKPRVARVKVEQLVANNGVKKSAHIDITQNSYNVKDLSSTFYQFGRKDAMPGVQTVSDGSFTQNGGNNMSIKNGIQNPGTFYTFGSSWSNNPPSGYSYYNLWSMESIVTGHNDNPVIKTIYDPCPAGFKMPASNAFTGFTTNGQDSGPKNVSGTWNNGWNFNNKVNNPDATIYFPASGSRNVTTGLLVGKGNEVAYWTASQGYTGHGCNLYFYETEVLPVTYGRRSYGFSVRPVAE